MPTCDPRIDEMIEMAPPFARPILEEVRKRVHASCPDVVETVKWRHASFEYHGILCGVATFKEHCAFGFWKHDLVVGTDRKALEAMGSFGRLTKVSDLPPKPAFAAMMKKAMRLNEEGIKSVRRKHAPKLITLHPAFKAALGRNKEARAHFEAFAPSKRREYTEWISDAKQEETRARRISQAVAWLAEGKSRNWKYME